MAAAAERNRCAICNKEKATLRCGGCSRDYCFNHVPEHRQELCKQLDEVEVSRDLFRQTLIEQTSQPEQQQRHPLVQQIDTWERESIEKIQQAANEARHLLVQHTTGRITVIESQLNKLTDELRKSRQEDDFFETDLARWMREIAQLNEALLKPSNINVRQNATVLVNRIVFDVETGKTENTVPINRSQILETPPPLIDRGDNRTRTNMNNQSAKRSSMENYDNQNYRIPTTRSLTALPKLRTTFEDSDDDNSNFRFWTQGDMSEYRTYYPNARPNPNMNDNYRFYTNQITFQPNGDYIDNIHRNWFGDYQKLEYDDGYIEWLFPLQERGSNRFVEPLQKHEIESIERDAEALKRILKSYQLMLDFYGFELVDARTGEVRRLRSDACRERFRNLNQSPSNFLRITRILKCLGEFDYERLKFPFLEAILRECITENTLGNCLQTCKEHWIETLRSQEERRAIRQYARELVEYRNKGLQPPTSHRAVRPTFRSATEGMSIGDDN